VTQFETCREIVEDALMVEPRTLGALAEACNRSPEFPVAMLDLINQGAVYRSGRTDAGSDVWALIDERALLLIKRGVRREPDLLVALNRDGADLSIKDLLASIVRLAKAGHVDPITLRPLGLTA